MNVEARDTVPIVQLKAWSWSRVALFLAGLAVAVALVAVGPPSNADANTDAILRILIVVLSIFSVFLIAPITMMGNPNGLFSGSWRIASAQSRQIRLRLNRFAFLFYMYLIAITAAVLISMLREHIPEGTYAWGKHVVLCFAIAALVWSFGLPAAIRRNQLQRLEVEVDKRRKKRERKPLDPP